MSIDANKRSSRHPQSVLNEYLEQLLAEVPEAEPEPLPAAVPPVAVVEAPVPVAAQADATPPIVEAVAMPAAEEPTPMESIPDIPAVAEAEPEMPAILPVDIPVAPPADIPMAPPAEPEAPPQTPVAEAVPKVAAAEQAEQESPVPEWAREPFQALLFEVAGLTLAVPLVELSGILEWSSEVTEMPGRSPWFLGLLAERGEQIKIVDPAVIVVPAKFRPPGYVEEIEKIILVGESKWGLACRSVSEVINLTPDAVRWRGDKSMRPWLAGTVIQHMCALLDVEQFVELLRSDNIEAAH